MPYGLMTIRQVSVLKTKRYAGDVEKNISFLWIKKEIIVFFKDGEKKCEKPWLVHNQFLE